MQDSGSSRGELLEGGACCWRRAPVCGPAPGREQGWAAVYVYFLIRRQTEVCLPFLARKKCVPGVNTCGNTALNLLPGSMEMVKP